MMKKKKEIILIGGGGHCKACIDVIETENKFRIIGIVDKREKVGAKVLGYKVFASDEDLPSLIKKYQNFLITVGQMKSPKKRRDLFTWLKKFNLKLPVIISPYAHISKHSEIDQGTIILHGVHVNAGVRIGKNCIINTSAVIEHDSWIEDHCHISTASIINGECHIAEGTFVGSNSVIRNNIAITKNTIIGAGSVVVKSINKSGIYTGNPGRRLNKNG